MTLGLADSEKNLAKHVLGQKIYFSPKNGDVKKHFTHDIRHTVRNGTCLWNLGRLGLTDSENMN